MNIKADIIPLSVSKDLKGENLVLPVQQKLEFPGDNSFFFNISAPSVWTEALKISLTLVLPDNAPSDISSLSWLKDRDHYWHQYVTPRHLQPGCTNTVDIPLHAEATGWNVPGHSLAWHHRVLLNPQSAGFRVFCDAAYTGKCVLVSATLTTEENKDPPEISNLRLLTKKAKMLSLCELRYDLPDRYGNPFDPEEIDVHAQVVSPSGTTNLVHGFYYHSHYRLEDELGRPVEPDGRPEWRLRFCPRTTGLHRITITAQDENGVCRKPASIEINVSLADKNAAQFIRVSSEDPRYYEFSDGSLYYPIGHNVRSATDARMDDKFPWRFRREEGTTAYRRYFRRMRENGENWAEVWMSAWSLGLEWTEGTGGYHGAGDYHMGNAWELDRVIDLAEKNGIYINLVFNYHGRISSWCDPEWHLHPYNKKTPGGWLKMPLEFFSDPKAVRMQKRFIRYTQARWGWSPSVFAYELCSELNLTGHETHHKTNFEPCVVEWCRTLGKYIKEIDPYRHLVSVHVSNDYKFLNPEISGMKEMDFNTLDAYHNTRPEAIIPLVSKTAAANTYNKPILITEFGGSPMAAGLEHLITEQHAALWAGICTPLSGTPMFWWWQIIDENDLYSRYKAVAEFMKGIDPRDSAAKQVNTKLELSDEESGDKKLLKQYRAICTASRTAGRGYIYPRTFPRRKAEKTRIQGLKIFIDGVQSGIFRIAFHDTETGRETRRFDIRSEEGYIGIPVPVFTNDCAFKMELITAIATESK
ncbi:MAG: DUF5060 domain-containing protein [Kiritimatiellia bacterium]